MKLYRDIMRRAWDVVIHHPVLWLCGLFLTISAGKTFVYEWRWITQFDTIFAPLHPLYWSELWAAIEADLQVSTWSGAWQVTAAVIVVLALLAVYWMMSLALAATLDAARLGGQPTGRRYALTQAWNAGRRHALTIGLIYAAARLLQLLLIASALWLLLFPGDFSTNLTMVWSLLSLVFVIPIVLLLHVWLRHSVSAAVLDHLGVHVSVHRGWLALRQMPGLSLELAGLAFVLFVAGLAIIPLLSAVMTLPFLALAIADSNNALGGGWALFYDGVYTTVTVLIIFLFTVFFSVWHVSAWGLLYQAGRQQTHRSVVYRLLRREVIQWGGRE